MIYVYDIGNEDFDSLGDAIIQPLSGSVKQVAGGGYDLQMEIAMDPDGKWKHLVPGAIAKVPVPTEIIENAFSGLDVDVYKTNTEAALREGASEPTVINYTAWQPLQSYAKGAKVTYSGKNYRCDYFDETSPISVNAPAYCSWWTQIPRYTTGAAALLTLPAGTELYFVEDYNTDWYKMSTFYGLVGYIKKSQVTYDRHLTPSQIEPRVITEQLFRITEPSIDNDGQKISVSGIHVSYDLAGILIQNVGIGQASPAMAIGLLMEGMMIPYRGTIATNLTSDANGTYTGEIKGKNGMYALLDPDKGIVSAFGAKFTRDNWDLFLMQKTTVDRGYQIRYGKNARGITWTKNSSNIITRVVPVAKDAKGADLYLPEKWIDSPLISNYPVIRMEMLQVKGQVGKDKGTGDGSTWTETDLLNEMRAKAGERFSVDHADEVVHEVTIQIEQLGDTAEYAWLKGLETVLLYDTVTGIEERIGLNVKLYVTEMEWDIVRKKIAGLKLSNVNDLAKRTVTGYNVQNNSISSEKLMDGVAQEIIQAAVDIMPEYADPNASRPATVTVNDSDPTLAWGTRSKVGDVQGTDLHVTMPANPIDGVSEDTTALTDNDYALKVASPSKKVTFGRVWNYIKDKISSVLGLTASNYNGKASTAGTADSANAVAWSDVTGKPGSYYDLPLAANGTRGGVQIGYSQNNKNYPVELSSEKMYVSVPWTDHYAWADITGKPFSNTSNRVKASKTVAHGSAYCSMSLAKGTYILLGYVHSSSAVDAWFGFDGNLVTETNDAYGAMSNNGCYVNLITLGETHTVGLYNFSGSSKTINNARIIAYKIS